MTNDKKLILHIDMNSYFATVEQQANPLLRGKPIGVQGSQAKRTIIAAASVEAKKFGVKTGMPVHEAKSLCPDIILVVGEPRKYSSVTKKFIEIFGHYTDKVEIFSIDEAFLDVTQTARLFVREKKKEINKKKPFLSVIPAKAGIQQDNKDLDPRVKPEDDKLGDSSFDGAKEIAKRIKSDIRQEIGEGLTCSIGIGPNKFLAKLGSNLEKPDGLVIITPENKDEILLSCKLTDFCGIANHIEKRLNQMEIYMVSDLRKADNWKLRKAFGVYGLRLKRMAWGEDSGEVLDWHFQADAKSFGHSRTLNKNVVQKKELEKQIYLLSEKVAKRMRDEGYFGREVGIWLRFADFKGVGKRRRAHYFINDGLKIYNEAMGILDQIWPAKRAQEFEKAESRSARRASIGIRAIGVYVTSITKNAPLSLFPEDKRDQKILEVMDLVNNRFGEDILLRGKILGFPLKRIVSGMGRKKF
ncbi:MAG: DNA polymerase IV [Patescibacteria group bacterium]|nr:DNA polymerase IV [Patescibacteria group bacterium]